MRETLTRPSSSSSAPTPEPSEPPAKVRKPQTDAGKVQRKPEVSAAGDASEREADAVADRVLRMADPAGVEPGKVPEIQRMGATEEEDEARKKPIQRDADPGSAGPEMDTESAVRTAQSGGVPLSRADRDFFEPRLDHDFSNVRVHADGEAASAARGIQARAYTSGEHIVLGAGQYAPGTSDGRRLLAHELTHVVQQGAAGQPLQRSRAAQAPASGTSNGQGLDRAPLASGEHAAGGLAIGSAPSGALQREEWTPEQKAAFFQWWKRIAGFEGTLKDWQANAANKADKGGETNFGITWATFQSVRKGATKEDFAALTPEGAMKIAEGLYRTYKADQITDPGVAILIAESFWGGFSADALNRALVACGRKATAKAGPLSADTITEINAADPQKLIDALRDEREKYHQAIVTSNPGQGIFQHGWDARFDARWIQAKILDGHADEAAKWLNEKSEKEIEEQLGKMSLPELAAVHEAAKTADGVGPDSKLVKITSRRYRIYRYQTAVAAGDWATAAYFMNGFNADDIERYLKLLKDPASVAKLHEAALADPFLGPDCELAKRTAAPGTPLAPGK